MKKEEIPHRRNILKIKYLNDRKRQNRHDPGTMNSDGIKRHLY